MEKIYKIKIIRKILFIIIPIIIFISFFVAKDQINKIYSETNKNMNNDDLFTYVVYDNKDLNNIKILIRISSLTGIEYVECPNGQTVYCGYRKDFSIDYTVKENETYLFTIKEVDKIQEEKSITVNNEITLDTSLNLKSLSDTEGQKSYEIKNITGLSNYKIYYRLKDTDDWINESNFEALDITLINDNKLNEDGSLTIYSKMINTSNNYEVYVTKIIPKENIRFPTNIESESLIKAVASSVIKNGVYEISVKDEKYSADVIYIENTVTLDGIQEIDGATLNNNTYSFGKPDDAGTNDSYAQNMVVLKVDGDLIVNNEVVLTAIANGNYGGPKGLFIYVTGNIINNGKISMTARGAKAIGQNVYLWKNDNTSQNYEYVPKEGAAGGNGYTGSSFIYEGVTGEKGQDGTFRSTGGGGSGSFAEYTRGAGYRKVGKGGAGTSYSGGTGGGGTWRTRNCR